MALNLNTSPYYDDFDATKNFNRILFKPGVAVQARELTQLQTVLSDQLSQLGSFTLKDGAIISGCEEKIVNINYIKITDADFDGAAVANSDLTNYVGDIITGGTTGLKAKILSVKTGSTGASPDTKVLYIAYTDAGGNTNTNQVLEFNKGETLTISSDDSTRNGNTFVTFNSGTDAVGSRTRYSGVAPFLTLSPGIIYALGNFIRTVEISTFIDRYTPLADRKIGFLVTESITTSGTDTLGATLVDPAQGSYNFNAPGADRLTYSATLASYSFRDTVPDNFFQYASFEFGKIVRSRIISDPLAEIGNIIAERAYNADGNYLIHGMQTYFREHLNDGKNGGILPSTQDGVSTKLVAAIRPGAANVAGYPVELLAEKLIPFDKPSATKIEQTVAQSTAFGNYVIVNDVCGAWDVDGSASVDLYSLAQNGVSGTNFSTTSESGTKVGVAKIRHISLLSGTPGSATAQYKLYLYDIRMLDGNFSAVKGIVYNSSLAKAFADIVEVNSKAQLYETNFNKLLWNLPYSHLKTLQADASAYDYSFKFMKEFDSSINTSAVINITSSISNQTFFFGNASPISNTLTEANCTLVATSSFDVDGVTYADGEIIPLNGKVSQTSETTLVIDLGTTATTGTVRLFVNLQISDTNPIGKSLESAVYVKIDATTNTNSASGKYSLGISDALRITQILATDNSDYTTNARNVTRDFIFDNGQKDNFYGLASIQKRSGSSLDLSTYRYLLVKLDYFSRSTAGPTFACVDSYPVDDTGAAGIKTEQIPMYKASNGTVFDLKNAVDFRPYIKNTAVNSSTISGATENPSILEQTDRPPNGLTNPVPTGEFITDLEYYLAEAYRIVITEEGQFRVLKSIPEVRPKTPKAPLKSMTLSTGYLPPYPCLSSKAAQYNNRADLSASTIIEKNKRYTMRDIGALEERISNLEYYTSLTLLEKQAGETKILDADGVDRFKNGYIVDAFTGFGINAVSHQDNNCSIDRKKRILRAAFDTTVVGFRPIATGTSAGQTGDMFHVPYFENIYTSQLQASKYRNVVGELLISNPVTPVTPTVPNTTAYSLVRSRTSVDEGSSVTITLETDNIAAGTNVPYTISGTGITTADIGGAALTGNFVIDTAGDAFLTLNVTADASTEGAEILTLTLDGTGVSTSITINDTSTTPAAIPAATGAYIGSLVLTPDEDTFFDMHSAPEPFTNNNGEWDNLLVGHLETDNGLTSGWSVEWGAWELATSTIGGGAPGDNFGVEFDGITENVDNGLYVPSYGVTWTNEGAIPAQSTTDWDLRYGSWTWTGPESTSETVVIDADTFLRPITISGQVDGLLPNAAHIITMDGIRKGTTTSNANGRASFTINVKDGEFRSGNLTVQVSNTESITSATSFAQAMFTANHTKNALITSEVTKPPMPSSPIVPEVRSITTATTVVSSSVTDKSTIFTEDSTDTVDIITTNGIILATGVTANELDQQDFEISSSCESGISRVIMQRPDGTTYGLEQDDPGCFEYSDTITTQNKASLSGQGETYDTTTKTTVTQQTSVNATVIADVTEFTNDNTGGVHVTTATLYADEFGTTLAENAADDFNFSSNVNLTVGGTNRSTGVVEVVTDPWTSKVNDARTDATLDTVLAEAFQFDFSSFDLFCLGDLYGNSGIDPLAQTFYVEDMPGGMYITSADIFFRSISAEENNNGITLQIREVVNGVPGTTIVSNGKAHLRRSSCFTSTIDASGNVNYASTNFKFHNPVYLKNDTEYALVLIPDADDPGYEVWIGQLGGIETGKTTRITKQAHTGVLYTSANNRSWSAHQSEDLMFVLRRAKFDVNKDFVVKASNKNTDWIKVNHTTWDTTTDADGRIPTPKFTKGDFVHGFKFTLDTAGSGYTDGTYDLVFTNTGTGGSNAAGTYVVSGGIVTTITLTNPGTGYTSAPTVALSNGSPATAATVSVVLNRAKYTFYDKGYSQYELEVTNGSFVANDLIGNGTTYVKIASIDNKAVSAYVLQASTTNADARGTITPKIAFTKTGAAAANTTYTNARVSSTEELEEEKTIYSYSNEVASYSSNKTALLEFTLRTSSNNVAPMIDFSSLDMLAIVNDINNPVTVSEEVATGGNALSKYISRQVVLAEGQDAEDLKVYLDSQIPSNGAVEVYAKVMNSADDADFLSEIIWKKLSIDTQPFVATNALAEYSYTIPAKASGWGVNASGVLEYDVTRVSDIPIASGGAGYSTTPTVAISCDDGNGFGATAEAIISGGAVTAIRILNPGRGFTGSVTVTLTGGGFSSAATIGTVTTDTVTYSGFKYYSVKIVHLSSSTAIIPKSTGLRAYALQA